MYNLPTRDADRISALGLGGWRERPSEDATAMSEYERYIYSRQLADSVILVPGAHEAAQWYWVRISPTNSVL